MKGQILAMTAIVMILTVIAIRIEFDSFTELERFDFQRSSVQTGQFQNIRDEFRQTSRLAFLEDPDGAYTQKRLSNFARFVRKREDAQVLYSVAAFKPPDTFKIYIGNFLDERLTGVNVKHNITGDVTTLTVTGDVLVESTAAVETLNTPDVEKTVQVNVTYIRKSTGVSETLSYIAFAGPLLNYTSTAVDVELVKELSSFSDVVTLRLAFNKSSATVQSCGLLCHTVDPGIT